MAYRDFSLAQIKKQFGLIEQQASLFVNPKIIEPSDWLKTTLNTSLAVAFKSPL